MTEREQIEQLHELGFTKTGTLCGKPGQVAVGKASCPRCSDLIDRAFKTLRTQPIKRRSGGTEK